MHPETRIARVSKPALQAASQLVLATQACQALRMLSGAASMPKYVIERQIPGAGDMTADDLQGASKKSCAILQNLGTDIQWVQSYVTADKLYCIYIAPSEQLIKQHAEESGFPANSIAEIKAIIDPTTSE